VEVPERLIAAIQALRASPFSHRIEWARAIDSERTPEDAVTALKRVHTLDHLRTIQAMSQTGGGFDTDTYCAPGSWEAMLDGTRAWLHACSVASSGDGPTLALTRPAGHHATADTALGFGLVNFAAAAVAAELAAKPDSYVAILDWDVHHGNGVADIFKDDARVRYCSTHEARLLIDANHTSTLRLTCTSCCVARQVLFQALEWKRPIEGPLATCFICRFQAGQVVTST